ncbi:MAG: paraquat-inducible protein A [Rhodobacteraceae bacterium]|mgnify:FL=1|uniref:Paraquat-inducible protein A n=1 Tax=Salipiger thiooxidans TaxID=282683 RepID=A0A1G7DK64_9RHOB|nr:paraquat-inducible protein A [Salipiger thiooxidans]MAU45761.1 paraquat-inducible membrane protein A [Salipiger sp.]NVK58894.1 paraquat-inducible protein A [Paracoccaceae bacterium]SDE51486.1 paraquat-inducible protein A [Salipiger thiooxidans]
MEDAGAPAPILTAKAAGLVGCTQCGRVHRPGVARCTRCGARLQSRDVTSLQRVWAWLFAGLVVYIPANIYPMLLTTILGKTSESTIFGGVVELMHHGSYGVAAIVFGASIVIPISKFIAIAYLALSVQHQVAMSAHRRHQLYEAVEFIGRWSMIDVFVVAILSSLVQLDFAASINPGIAAVSFALSVAFTMISAQSFDSRLIWDVDGE